MMKGTMQGILSKVLRSAKGTSLALGLAVVLALVAGVATTADAAKAPRSRLKCADTADPAHE